MGQSQVARGTTSKQKCKNCSRYDWLEYCRICNSQLYHKEKKKE